MRFHFFLRLCALALASATLGAAACGGESSRRVPAEASVTANGTDSATSAGGATVGGASIGPAPAPLVPTPQVVRGLYVNRWAALGKRMGELIDVARRTEVNALVIDVKDDRGLVLYRSRVPLAQEIGADTTMPMSPSRVRAMLDTMRAHNIYPIARIVVVKDPLLAAHQREWAIRLASDTSRVWLDRSGIPWLDPHQPGVWDYAVDLAREAVELGFSEIQFDYVRFPDEQRLTREAAFSLAAGRPRAQVIREHLGAARAALAETKVRITADVFGLTTTDTTDMGIGQRWESFIDQADVVLPMMYPSHYAPGSYGIRAPNARPYEIIDHGLKDAARRSAGIAGAALVIPWYQDFTLGPPRYGVEQVRAQMRAGYDNGVESWILWNPGSRYTIAALRRDTSATLEPAARPAADTTP